MSTNQTEMNLTVDRETDHLPPTPMEKVRPLTGEECKQQGMDAVARNNGPFLIEARQWARKISQQHGRVTADDVRRACAVQGLEPTHMNAWGCVFKESGWHKIGYTKSTRPISHSSVIGVWQWVGA